MIPALAPLLNPRDIKPDTAFDIILRAHLEGRKDELSAEHQAMLTRWRQVDSMIRNGYTIKKGKNDITQPYNFSELAKWLVSEYRISYRTAYDDIKHAKRFFLSNYSRDDKEFGRGVMIEWGEKFMFEAASMGDYKSAAAFFKALAEIKGLTKDDPDLPDYTQIQLPTLVLVADPSELGFPKVENPDEVVKRILAKRKRDKIDKLIEDSELAKVIDDERREEDLAE